MADEQLSRRGFFKAATVAGAAAALPLEAVGQTAEAPAVETTSERVRGLGNLPPPVRFFFTEPEAAFVAAAVDRLIPPDEWPGAAEASVVEYIDRQLAGAYGNGERLYLQGPWAEGTPQQGYQLPYTPAQLYRIAIEGIRLHVAEQYNERRFDELEVGIQDEILTGLERGTIELPDLPSPVFFETLLANTVEGFFSDPVYGGNRDMVGWRMLGFPGAYAQYVDLVENHGQPFDRPPMSMAESILHQHG